MPSLLTDFFARLTTDHKEAARPVEQQYREILEALANDREPDRDEVLIVLESMKLFLPLTAPRDGEIATVHAAPGQTVPAGMLLVALAPDPSE